MYNFVEQIKTELAQVNYLIEQIDRMNLSDPPGSMICEIRGGELQYSMRVKKRGTSSKRRLLGGVEDQRVQNIKRSKYYLSMRRILEKDKHLLERIASRYLDYSPDSVERELPFAYRTLPPDCYRDPQYEQLVKWAEEPYDQNERAFTPSSCITVDGTKVRSKAEAIIYNMLKFYGIPFRYEQKLTLIDSSNGYKEFRYPDFTILLANGQKLHWEHFGLLNRDKYFEAFCNKIRLYYQNDLTAGDNLIITSDDQNGGLNTYMIELIIRSVLLPQVKARS